METILSKREEEILYQLDEGKQYKQIADTLFISHKTVKTHAHKIYKKLVVKNRYQAVKKYFGNK